MAKKIVRIAKLEFNAGQAKPGPELAGLGIVMPEFTRQFNDQTKDRGNEPVPVEITIYKDKSFTFRLFTSPAAYKLKQAAKIEKGSANSKTTKVATITRAQLKEIAEYKLVDLNTDDINMAIKIIAGTAKNMGILVEGLDNVSKELEKAQEASIAELKAQAAEQKLEDAVKANLDKDAKVSVEVIGQKDDNEGEN